MTADAPLTDEELAELYGFIRRAGYSPDYWRGRHSSVFVTGLIADLQAARAEVERLRGELRQQREMGFTLLAALRAVEKERAVDLQQIASGVLIEYGLHQEDVFHAATLIAERAEEAALGAALTPAEPLTETGDQQ